MNSDIKQSKALFTHYEGGLLWYDIKYTEEDSLRTLSFPIPLKETAAWVFTPVMQGKTLMRWIDKELKKKEEELITKPTCSI